MEKQIKTHFLIILVVAIFSSGTVPSVLAKEGGDKKITPAYDPVTRTINVYQYNLKPWSWMGKDGKPTGSNYDTVKWIVERAGYKLNVISMAPFARAIQYLKDGQSYFQAVYVTKDMEKDAFKACLGGYIDTVVVGLKGHDFSKREDLYGKKIAFVRETATADPLLKDPLIKLSDLTTLDQGVKMLAAGRLDGLIENFGLINLAAKSQGLKLEFGKPLLIARAPWHILVSKKAHIEEVTNDLIKAMPDYWNIATPMILEKWGFLDKENYQVPADCQH